MLDVNARRYKELRAATWGASCARIVSQIRAVQRQVDEALERKRLLIQIRVVLGVDDVEAARLAEEFGAEDVVQAGHLGWTPSTGVDPWLFVLANRVTW